jgi:hypothetical protein
MLRSAMPLGASALKHYTSLCRWAMFPQAWCLRPAASTLLVLHP